MSSASSYCSCSGALWSLLQKRIELAEQMMLIIPRIISSWHRIPPPPLSSNQSATSELHCVYVVCVWKGACVQSVFVALFRCYCICTCVLSNLFDSWCYALNM